MPKTPQIPNLTQGNATGSLQPPRLICGFTVLLLIPVWFVTLLALIDSFEPIDNPFAPAFYMFACLAGSIFVVPITCFAVAPTLSKLSRRSNRRALIVHIVTGLLAAIIFGLLPSIAKAFPLLNSTLLPVSLSIFLVPPRPDWLVCVLRGVQYPVPSSRTPMRRQKDRGITK